MVSESHAWCTVPHQWCGLNIWERISLNICDLVSFCFAAVVIDVNAFEPKMIISIVCSYVGSCMVERIRVAVR